MSYPMFSFGRIGVDLDSGIGTPNELIQYISIDTIWRFVFRMFPKGDDRSMILPRPRRCLVIFVSAQKHVLLFGRIYVFFFF